MTTRTQGWLATAILLGTACDEVSCQWTDDPDDPWTSHQPERRYRSDDGRFDVVLRAEGPWPPVVGSTSVRIEWIAIAPQGDARMSEMIAERPHRYDGDFIAEIEPVVVPLEPMIWRVDELELDAPGRWVVPLVIEGEDFDDAFDLQLEVEDDG